MPVEGPQTRILAEQLHDRLAGRCVERIDVPGDRWQANVLLMNCVGQVVQRVHARGRWVLADFSQGTTWACCAVGRSGWQEGEVRGKPLVTVVLRGGEWAVVAGRPVFLTLPTERVWEHEELRRMGPDPLAEDFELEAMLVRLRKAAGRTMAAVLLDDGVVAGVGNMLKCEILYAARLWPGRRVGTLYASELERVAGTAADVVRETYRKLRGGETVEEAVYDRAGEPCRLCGAEIAADRSAGDGHWTWYCPQCQPRPTEGTLFGESESK